MYQSLIWLGILSDDPCRLRATLDAEDLERLPDALVHGMRRNLELSGDFLGTQMLVNQPEAVELTWRQTVDALSDGIVGRMP